MKKKILVAPDFYMEGITHEATKLQEKLTESGYEVMVAKIGKSLYVTLDNLEEEHICSDPDLIVSFGLGCLLIGQFCNVDRLMVNPDYSLSTLAKEKMDEYKKVLDFPEMENGDDYLIGYAEASKMYEESMMLENPDTCLKGKGKMLGIFSENFADEESTHAYMERYGAYKVIPDLDTSLTSGIEKIIEEIKEI